MKKIILIHKEPGKKCFEVLKRSLIDEKDLELFRIDEDTRLQKLPVKVVDQFLEFLQIDGQTRDLMLRLNQSGTLLIKFEQVIVYDN